MTRPLDFIALAAFSEEVRTSTPAILAALDAVERDRADAASAHEAYRLIHALKGAASMVGLAALGYLLNQAEDLLDHVVAGPTELSDELVALLRATTPRFAEYVEAAAGGQPTEPIAIDLARAYRAYAGQPDADDATLRELLDGELRELATHAAQALSVAEGVSPELAADDVEHAAEPFGEPAPELDVDLAPADAVPSELAEVFAQEAHEHLQVIARITGQISAGPIEREAVLDLRRAVHTLKGAAGVVGYKAASRLAHRMEDLLDRLYEGTTEMTPEAGRMLAASSDTLDDLIAGAADPGALRAALARLMAGYDALIGEAEPAAPAPVSTQPDAVMPAGAAAPPESAPRAVLMKERRKNPDRRRNVEDRRGGGQIARVPFQRLSDLVRIVSELVINRSTFDQHYAGLIDQVDELKLSTARLRRVALKLETDYEVRALAGHLAAATPGSLGPVPGSGHGFDELEFDRYTDFHLLTRELTETASDIGTISTRLGETISDFDGDLTRLGRLTRDVQDKVMEFRMVPLVTLAARLERAVRVTAESCGKAIDLVLEGENVALDKTLLEEMTDPLLHLLRNAVDHGIETPEVRLASGKSERGRIVVRASHEGTDVLIEVEDDGGGLDFDRIRRTAIERGYTSDADAASLTSDALAAFVFEPGFSTAQRVSEVSGRGVGLDIVKAKVTRLNGRVRLTSQPGAGATVTVRVPMTLAITRVLLIRAGGETLGIPLGAVTQIVRPDPTAIAHVGAERVLTVDKRTYPLRDLAETLGLPHAPDAQDRHRPALIASLGGRRVALIVDAIVQSRDAVVKTLGTHLRRVTGVWGATLLGDGTVILILNPADLAGAADERPVVTPISRAAIAPAADHKAQTVLIVDDSLSMRHVLSNAIKRAGWNAIQARDGVDALEVLHRALTPPDLILLDIEMPRMDGYEFLATVRSQQAYGRLPIVMLTSRGGEKHRDKAIALGATDYVVKPFQEEALLQTIGRLMGAARLPERKAS